MKILFIILGIVMGEIALVLFTSFAQEVVFDGISYNTSDNTTLIIGGLLTFAAAILAGVVARIVGRTYTRIIPLVISVIIIIEMTYLITSGITNDPVWFDIIAGGSLILGIWVGYHAKLATFLRPKNN